MLTSGQTIALRVDKPAAGGRMIARVDGQVVLVANAIPGERVTARVERVGRGVVYAYAVSVDEPSADRREPFPDPACGGCAYSHIAYSRQVELKALVVADAFARVGKLRTPGPIPVTASEADGYRMRARLHRKGRAIGFYREGTHELCSARDTRQLLPATCEALDGINRLLQDKSVHAVATIEVAENVDGSERVVHLEPMLPADAARLESMDCPPLITGVTGGGGTLTGAPHVTDVLTIDGHRIALRRHVRTFFQGNRYLLAVLVQHVIGHLRPGGEVIDLYAGAGLFAVSVASVLGSEVTAVESDAVAARDLADNSATSRAKVTAIRQPVELFTAGHRGSAPGAVIVDPPRTGLSPDAVAGLIGLSAARIVYVSCDVATLARDARRLVDGGYQLGRLAAFDLFPNTPHVETVAIFDSAGHARESMSAAVATP
jgi:23S rRNA (uracil1939-C5)-methyltransferase